MFSMRLNVLLLSLVAAGFAFGPNQKTCPRFHIKAVKKRTIVLAHKSQENGAVYLDYKYVSGFHDCYSACCDTPTCNMVNLNIPKDSASSSEETKAKCYMFNCGKSGEEWKCLYHSQSTNRNSFNANSDSDVANYAVLEFEDFDTHPKTWKKKNRYSGTKTKNPTSEISTKAELESTQASWLDSIKTGHDRIKTGHDRIKTGMWFDKLTTEKQWRIDHPTTMSWPTTPTTTKEPARQYGGYHGSKYSFDRDDIVKGSRAHEKTPMPTTEPGLGFDRRVWVDNNPDYPEPPRKYQPPRTTNTPLTPSGKIWMPSKAKMTTPRGMHEDKTYLPWGTKATSKVGTHQTKAPVDTKKPELNSVVIKRFNIQENKAVIPLAVGLVLSLLLLMAVVFRLKTSRRRRTKAFLTDDADYLINGMYL